MNAFGFKICAAFFASSMLRCLPERALTYDQQPDAPLAYPQLPEAALVVEATIPFKISKSLRENHDGWVRFGFGSAWFVSHPNLLRIDSVDNSVTAIELPGIAGPIREIGIGEGAVWV